MPEITLPDYKSLAKEITKDKKDVTVTDEELDKVLLDLRKMRVKKAADEEIKDEDLPVLDDAFAQSFGEEFATVEILKNKIKENSLLEKEQIEKEKLRSEVLEKLQSETKAEIKNETPQEPIKADEPVSPEEISQPKGEPTPAGSTAETGEGGGQPPLIDKGGNVSAGKEEIRGITLEANQQRREAIGMEEREVTKESFEQWDKEAESLLASAKMLSNST